MPERRGCEGQPAGNFHSGCANRADFTGHSRRSCPSGLLGAVSIRSGAVGLGAGKEGNLRAVELETARKLEEAKLGIAFRKRRERLSGKGL